MTSSLVDNRGPQPSRREFLKNGTAVALAGATFAGPGIAAGAYAAGSDVLKVGLIGCGGRGTGAAAQALRADPQTKLVAMGDAFIDRLNSSLANLKRQGFGSRIAVDEDHKFDGFENYKHVIAESDVVILTTPPHFRPEHLRAAIEAGKHVFCEKPVAVDGPGVNSVLQTSGLAKKKGLTLVSGLCWRYHYGMQETFQQIHDGTIGEITALQCSYNSAGVWDPRKNREQVKSDMEYQMRNWYYYTWLSGDFNVEQHVHSLDKMAWAMQDEYPVKVSGTGGRIQRTDPKYGDVFDHFNVVYEYARGIKLFARCRHFRGSTNDVTDHVYGSKGRMEVFRHSAYDYQGRRTWRFKGKRNNMYQAEHDEMFRAIRAGKPINNGRYMTLSSMMAIAGRMSAYTGKTITWEQAMQSKQKLGPREYKWGDAPEVRVPVPGVTPFV